MNCLYIYVVIGLGIVVLITVWDFKFYGPDILLLMQLKFNQIIFNSFRVAAIFDFSFNWIHFMLMMTTLFKSIWFYEFADTLDVMKYMYDTNHSGKDWTYPQLCGC